MDNDDSPIKRPRGRPRKPKPEGLEQLRRPRGRPALGGKSKSISITLRVTRREHAILKQLAKDQGLTLRDFMMKPFTQLLLNRGDGNDDCMLIDQPTSLGRKLPFGDT